MISPEKFFSILKDRGIDFYTGVPDSLLKNFCSYVTENVSKENHIINSNEGAAIALATGYHLATGKIPLVYMQNSGLGNSVNPLMSLADKEVYNIPILLMIGWRGEPGNKDEPQHKKQGRVMLDMLKAMEIPYSVINASTADPEKIIDEALNELKKKSAYALVISEGTFEDYKMRDEAKDAYTVSREDALKIILTGMSKSDIVVSTTGKTSREIFELREKSDQGHQNDFLTVGSMGHCSEIALGIAMQRKDSQVFVIDGDGAVIMHMGNLAITGTEAPANFKHIIINNSAHESVGGQPTAGFRINFCEIAKACGYRTVMTASNEREIESEFGTLKQSPGPSLLEIRVNKHSRKDLGRPTTTPEENKKSFMEFLKS